MIVILLAAASHQIPKAAARKRLTYHLRGGNRDCVFAHSPALQSREAPLRWDRVSLDLDFELSREFFDGSMKAEQGQDCKLLTSRLWKVTVYRHKDSSLLMEYLTFSRLVSSLLALPFPFLRLVPATRERR